MSTYQSYTAIATEPKTFYTCNDATSGPSLLASGASKMTISYTYELETPTILLSDGVMQDVLSEAMDRVQNVMLARVAERSGLMSCGEDHPWRRERRQLLEGEVGGAVEGETTSSGHLRRLKRGGNSIIGLSSQPIDVADSTAQCTGASVIQPMNDIQTEFTGSVEAENQGILPFNDELMSEIDSSAAKRTSGIIQTRSSETIPDNNGMINSNSNEIKDVEADVSFNYISTQSLPQSRTSNSNPHTYSPAGSDFLSNFSPRMTTKCTVIQGYMTVFTNDATAYENLDGRIVDALEEDLNSPILVKELFLSDVVLGVRFSGMTGVSGAPTSEIDNGAGVIETSGAKETSSQGDQDWMGTVSAIQGRPSSAAEDSPSIQSSGFSFPLMILVSLGMLFLVLSALFVYTSKPHVGKRSKRDVDSMMEEENYEQGEYYEDEMEMDLNVINYAQSESDYGTSVYTESESEYSSSANTRSNFVSITSCHQEYGQEEESNYVFSTRARSGVSHTGSGQVEIDVSGHTTTYGGESTSCELNSIHEQGVQIHEANRICSQDEDDDYSIHSIHMSNQTVTTKTSHNTSNNSFLHNPLAVISFGRNQSDAGSLASKDSLSPARSTKKRTSYPSPSRFLWSRNNTQQRMPPIIDDDGCESVARDAFVDETNVEEYDPDSAGLEVSLTPNFWRIGRVNSFV